MNEQNPIRVALLQPGGGRDETTTALLDRGLAGLDLDLVADPARVAPHHRLLHLPGFGPAATAALHRARTLSIPVATLLDRGLLATSPGPALAAFHRSCDVVLSPGPAGDRALLAIGVAPERINRYRPGVELERFSPACFRPDAIPGGGPLNLLYDGPLTRTAGVALLADAFLLARDRDPRLRLVLLGDEQRWLADRLGRAATFLSAPDLPPVYASCDLLVVPSADDGTAAKILAAQASGLPVVAVDDPTTRELIEPGRSGCLVQASPAWLAEALRGLARRATLLDRLATGGLQAVRGRTWERALEQLAAGWAAALAAEVACAA